MPYTTPKQRTIHSIIQRAIDLTGHTIFAFQQWILEPLPLAVLKLIDQQQLTFIITQKKIKLPFIINPILINPAACRPLDLFKVMNITVTDQAHLNTLESAHPLYDILMRIHYPHARYHEQGMQRIARAITGLTDGILPDVTTGYELICHEHYPPRFFTIGTPQSENRLTQVTGHTISFKIKDQPCNKYPLHTLEVNHTQNGARASSMRYAVSELICESSGFQPPIKLVPIEKGKPVKNTAIALGAYVRDCRPTAKNGKITPHKQTNSKVKNAQDIQASSANDPITHNGQHTIVKSFTPFMFGLVFHFTNTFIEQLIHWSGNKLLKQAKAVCIGLISIAAFMLAPAESTTLLLTHHMINLTFNWLQKNYKLRQKDQYNVRSILSKLITFLTARIIYTCMSNEPTDSFESVVAAGLFEYTQLLMAENIGVFSAKIVTAMIGINRQPTYQLPPEAVYLIAASKHASYTSYEFTSRQLQMLHEQLRNFTANTHKTVTTSLRTPPSTQLKNRAHTARKKPAKAKKIKPTDPIKEATSNNQPGTKKPTPIKKKSTNPNKEANPPQPAHTQPPQRAIVPYRSRAEILGLLEQRAEPTKDITTVNIHESFLDYINQFPPASFPHSFQPLKIDPQASYQPEIARAILPYRPSFLSVLRLYSQYQATLRLPQTKRNTHSEITSYSQALPTHTFGQLPDVTAYNQLSTDEPLILEIKKPEPALFQRAQTVIQFTKALGIHGFLTGGAALRFIEAAFGMAQTFDIDHSDLDMCVTEHDYALIIKACRSRQIAYTEMTYTIKAANGSRSRHKKMTLLPPDMPPIDIIIMPVLSRFEQTLSFHELQANQKQRTATAGLMNRFCGVKALSLEFTDGDSLACRAYFPKAGILNEVIEKKIRCHQPNIYMQADWPLLYATMTSYTLGEAEEAHIKTSMGEQLLKLNPLRKLDCLLKLSNQASGNYLHWLFNKTTQLRTPQGQWIEYRLLSLLFNVPKFNADNLDEVLILINSTALAQHAPGITQEHRLTLHLLIMWFNPLQATLRTSILSSQDLKTPPQFIDVIYKAMHSGFQALLLSHLGIDFSSLQRQVDTQSSNAYGIHKFAQIQMMCTIAAQSMIRLLFPRYVGSIDLAASNPLTACLTNLMVYNPPIQNCIGELISILHQTCQRNTVPTLQQNQILLAQLREQRRANALLLQQVHHQQIRAIPVGANNAASVAGAASSTYPRSRPMRQRYQAEAATQAGSPELFQPAIDHGAGQQRYRARRGNRGGNTDNPYQIKNTSTQPTSGAGP